MVPPADWCTFAICLSPVSIFQNDWGAEPKTLGVFFLDTIRHNVVFNSVGGRAHIVTHSDFC